MTELHQSTEASLDQPHALEWDRGRQGFRRVHFSEESAVAFVLGTELRQGKQILVQTGDTEQAVLDALGPVDKVRVEDTLPGYKVLCFTAPEELEVVLYQGRVASDHPTSGVVSAAIHLRSSDWVYASRN